MDKKVLDQLFESLNLTLESDELKGKVSALVEELVNNRAAVLAEQASAENEQLKSNIAALNEEMAAKDQIVNEEVKKFTESLIADQAAREAVMIEEIGNYKTDVESAVGDSAKEFRESVEKLIKEEAQHEMIAMREAFEKIIMEESANFKEMMESVTMEELASYTESQEAELAEDVNKFKEDIVESVSKFFETEFKNNIPQEIMESATKVAAFEPLIEGIVSTFTENYVKVDTPAYDVLKTAKTKIEELSESVNAKTSDNVRLAERVKELERKSKISDLTEGMTTSQRSKAVKFLENVNVEDMESKFSQVKDLIITESVTTKSSVLEATPKSTTKVLTETEKPVLSEPVQKKLASLKAITLSESASASTGEMADWEKRLKNQLKG